eukprot:GHUV01046998.1.p1 GENE.GHUV01046998.1~~GHUV01046998.1.p1  ORF type:complete len:121 (-),score=9.79 GHUV01046998.1:318-680(-)
MPHLSYQVLLQLLILVCHIRLLLSCFSQCPVSELSAILAGVQDLIPIPGPNRARQETSCLVVWWSGSLHMQEGRLLCRLNTYLTTGACTGTCDAKPVGHLSSCPLYVTLGDHCRQLLVRM